MTQLKAGIQLIQTTFLHLKIDRLMFCGNNAEFAGISDGLAEIWQDQVFYSDPITQLQCGVNVDAQLLSAAAPFFLIACGLAMREVPKW